MHLYLATICRHREHDYCSFPVGVAGVKTPATCKFCRAACWCPCHATGWRRAVRRAAFVIATGTRPHGSTT